MLITLQIVSALVTAGILFMQAAGLTLIFGVSRVLNLAHGSLFMLALFMSYAVSMQVISGPAGFWIALLVVPLAMAAIGVVVEVLLFRRIYQASILVQVLLTIGIIYVVGDLVRLGWGLTSKSVPTPDLFGAPIQLMGIFIPAYYAFVLAVSAAVAALLWFIVQKTTWGLLIRAAAQDRTMSSALGVNPSLLFTSVFGLSMWLVGVAAVLYAPIGGASPGSDVESMIEAFAVVVIGGLGSIWGAIAAALMIGFIKAFGILVLPQYAMSFVFVLMAVILVIRPRGLFGAAE
ncbi:MAG TPA: branched-chain amino acid ABC transporter permease [Ferrovibrio sp.]|uniref:branched-chain amino acid ABC transporter permease n=1 Tax=Ferrovibrio sp. TaxID=1917215 RepID=UPI002ED26947